MSENEKVNPPSQRPYSYPLDQREEPLPRKKVPFNGLGKPLPQKPNDPDAIKRWLNSPWNDAIDLLEGTEFACEKANKKRGR